MLERLIYVSRSHQPLPLDLKDILAASRRNNPAVGVTGALCFIDGTYFQYLEGEGDAIGPLYERIARDGRHRDPKLLHTGGIADRLFEKWSMALVTLDENTRRIIAAVTQRKDADLYELSPGEAQGLMQALAVSANWSTV
jgi:hypothetical protein